MLYLSSPSSPMLALLLQQNAIEHDSGCDYPRELGHAINQTEAIGTYFKGDREKELVLEFAQ